MTQGGHANCSVRKGNLKVLSGSLSSNAAEKNVLSLQEFWDAIDYCTVMKRGLISRHRVKKRKTLFEP